MNLYTILVYIGIFAPLVIIFLFISGGSYLQMRIKARLPFLAGKGKNLLHFDKTGIARFDYVIVRKGNVINKGDDAIRLEGTHHSFLDATKLDKHTTIHQLDKEPLYITVEGAPTNVLVQKRDYDEDLSKLNYILKQLDVISQTGTEEEKAKFNKNLIIMFNKLIEAFKYLDPAKKICYFTIKKVKEMESSETEVELKDYFELYKIAIANLISILKKKNSTMINFTDYFTEINLSRIFNAYFKDANQLGRREALIGVQKENSMVKIGGVILILGMLGIGYLVYDMSGKLKSQTEVLSSLATSIDALTKTLVDPDTNQLKVPASATIPNTPIQGNPIIGGS